MAGRIFEFYFTDEINARLRRMLTIEHTVPHETARLYRKLSFDDSLEYQTKLFEEMYESGCFRQADPYTLALAFYAPIYLIFCKFDNGGSVRGRESCLNGMSVTFPIPMPFHRSVCGSF
jgi:hypothetical protein